MVIFANKLDELLSDAVLAQGLNRQIKRKTTVDYIKSISETQFKREISEIIHLPALEMLNSLGVKKEVYPIFLQAIAKARKAEGLK
ncbi:MAG: hypothetical protein KGI06_05875 [Candidatus Micrarchaeota archaeon]|nr:hypothetical protein [Candidatus Micrarchaeota archaeon]